MKRTILLAVAFLGMYLAGAGAFQAVVDPDRSFLEAVARPLAGGMGFDALAAMACTGILAFVMFAREWSGGINRTSLLQGIAFGSAVVTTLCFVIVLSTKSGPDLERSAIFALVALFQAAVGVAAGMFLLLNRGSRRAAAVPLLLNGALASVAAVVLCDPFVA